MQKDIFWKRNVGNGRDATDV